MLVSIIQRENQCFRSFSVYVKNVIKHITASKPEKSLGLYEYKGCCLAPNKTLGPKYQKLSWNTEEKEEWNCDLDVQLGRCSTRLLNLSFLVVECYNFSHTLSSTVVINQGSKRYDSNIR